VFVQFPDKFENETAIYTANLIVGKENLKLSCHDDANTCRAHRRRRQGEDGTVGKCLHDCTQF